VLDALACGIPSPILANWNLIFRMAAHSARWKVVQSGSLLESAQVVRDLRNPFALSTNKESVSEYNHTCKDPDLASNKSSKPGAAQHIHAEFDRTR
jgi:hypothetical protein